MQVAELWRYPVKGLAGEPLERANLLSDGVEGDRLVRIESDDETVTARTKPRLIGLSGALDSEGSILVEGNAWETDAAAESVRAVVGETARLVRVGETRFDLAPILVTTDGALGEFGEDRRRYRPNLVVSGVKGMAERSWPGRHLRVGEAVLVVREPCERCIVTTIDPDSLELNPSVLTRLRGDYEAVMGVYCEVLQPGEVAVGDPVELN
jgi:uncharacterized protein YcbX